MKKPPGIAIEKTTTGRESIALQRFSLDQAIPCRFVNTSADVPAGWMAVGSTEFVENVIGRKFVPDHFPDFCNNYVCRKWNYQITPLPEDRPVFLKPGDTLKRFDGYLRQPGDHTWPGPWIIQEPVQFTREFRYYILHGEVLTGEWYPTDESPNLEPISEAPELPGDIRIPDDWNGTLDFGNTADGRFLLVEAHPPFACGWYGESEHYKTYAHWLIGGWNTLINK